MLMSTLSDIKPSAPLSKQLEQCDEIRRAVRAEIDALAASIARQKAQVWQFEAALRDRELALKRLDYNHYQLSRQVESEDLQAG